MHTNKYYFAHILRMSYLEIKRRNNERYAYFVKKWSLQGKRFVLRRYIGKATSMVSKESFLSKNMGSLVDEELNLRKPIWEKAISISHDPRQIEKVEKKKLDVFSVFKPHGLRGYIFLEALLISLSVF